MTFHALDSIGSGQTSSVTSGTYIVSTPRAGFTLSAASNHASVKAGGSAVFYLSVESQNGFSQPVKFSCSGLPQNSTCSFTPSSVTPSANSSAASTLTISTASAPVAKSGSIFLWWVASSGMAAGLVRWPVRRRRRLRGIFILICAAAIGAGLGGCGTVLSPSAPSPSAQTYSVAVAAAGGSLTQSMTITLTVEN